ncbi:putative autophagy-related protein 11 isoform X2 [Halyomorpha halys]|uniref:putative autophagy-related protein 11 isoform X2 n=1 Tax=Halyomorpha halys TaxID=286706 RepID=UPI0034D2BA2D
MLRIGSSELNADEAEAITRSMDMSLAFWGTSKEPPEKIPATRLKCPLQHPGKASGVALKIWEKMTQKDLDKVREIEVSLMTEGEIGTLELYNTLKYIIESIGMEFEEMLKSVDDDPIESTISLTNEILHIFNLNEPPEILEDEEYGTCMHYSPISNACQQHERQRKDISNKIKALLNKAHEMGIYDVRIPSSPYLTERSKLSLIEKQISSKMKLRNVKKIFEDKEKEISDDCSYSESKLGQSQRYQKRKSFLHQKKEPKRTSLADRPKFRSAVKSETVRCEDLFKHTPDITKRIRKVREIRKKFMEKSKSNSDSKSSSNLFSSRNTKNRHLATPHNNYNNHSHKGRTPKVYKRYHLPQMHNSCIRDYSLNDRRSSTRVIIGSTETMKNDDNFVRSSNILQKHISRNDMKYEMKKMINEAVQAVTGSNRLKHSVLLSDDRKTLRIKARERNQSTKLRMSDISPTMQPTTNALNVRDDNSYSSYENKQNDTIVTVKQEAALQSKKKEENKVSTEVKISRGFGSPGLKVSVISKVSGNDEIEDVPRERSRKDIREAISILKEYIALKNNGSLSRIESGSVQKVKDKSLMLTSITSEEVLTEKNITSETVTKTEVIIEPNSKENITKEEETKVEETEMKSNEYQIWNDSQDEIDEGLDQTYQTFAVTMLMPMSGGCEEARFYSPFHFGDMFFNHSDSIIPEQVGDVGDNGWPSWDNPIWQSIHLDDITFTANVNNESDSLYVNTSQEQINSNSLAEDSSMIEHQSIETTLSSLSVVIVEKDARSRCSYGSMIAAAASGLHRIFINSILGVVALFFKPLNLIAALKVKRNENDQ